MARGSAAEDKPDFFLAQRGEPSTPVHVAFRSPDRRTVDEFHAAAIAAGGKDNGPPGIRRVYHEYYYGAYVLDPKATTSKPSRTSPSDRGRVTELAIKPEEVVAFARELE